MIASLREFFGRFAGYPAWLVMLWCWTAIFAIGVLLGSDEDSGYSWFLCVLVAAAFAGYLWARLGQGWEIPHGLAWLVLFLAIKLPALEPLAEFALGAPLSVALAYLFRDRPR